jgi:hypothetical protein
VVHVGHQNVRAMMAYSAKDALKNMFTDNGGRFRTLMTRGWLPPGAREVNRLGQLFYMRHYIDWEERGYETPEGRDFIPMVREVIDDMIWRWCNGEEVLFDLGDGMVLAEGDKFYGGEQYGIL